MKRLVKHCVKQLKRLAKTTLVVGLSALIGFQSLAVSALASYEGGVQPLSSPKNTRGNITGGTFYEFFPDAKFAQAVADCLGKQPNDKITATELATLTSLHADNYGIQTIEEKAKLEILNLKHHLSGHEFNYSLNVEGTQTPEPPKPTGQTYDIHSKLSTLNDIYDVEVIGTIKTDNLPDGKHILTNEQRLAQNIVINIKHKLTGIARVMGPSTINSIEVIIKDGNTIGVVINGRAQAGTGNKVDNYILTLPESEPLPKQQSLPLSTTTVSQNNRYDITIEGQLKTDNLPDGLHIIQPEDRDKQDLSITLQSKTDPSKTRKLNGSSLNMLRVKIVNGDIVGAELNGRALITGMGMDSYIIAIGDF